MVRGWRCRRAGAGMLWWHPEAGRGGVQVAPVARTHPVGVSPGTRVGGAQGPPLELRLAQGDSAGALPGTGGSRWHSEAEAAPPPHPLPCPGLQRPIRLFCVYKSRLVRAASPAPTSLGIHAPRSPPPTRRETEGEGGDSGAGEAGTAGGGEPGTQRRGAPRHMGEGVHRGAPRGKRPRCSQAHGWCRSSLAPWAEHRVLKDEGQLWALKCGRREKEHTRVGVWEQHNTPVRPETGPKAPGGGDAGQCRGRRAHLERLWQLDTPEVHVDTMMATFTVCFYMHETHFSLAAEPSRGEGGADSCAPRGGGSGSGRRALRCSEGAVAGQWHARARSKQTDAAGMGAVLGEQRLACNSRGHLKCPVNILGVFVARLYAGRAQIQMKLHIWGLFLAKLISCVQE
ncbi:hypothetical protein NDU88_005175 [Pleurodeles waltl]|uniref:Uncharacterized protein n=1 Tax=Pleurodeles waltl TaxID=8319 RepID=A0AAV7L429_PLEWA|nr:hypothetical protein NDU88_005175 [Pleurodeles waltl]